jgi:zinc transporter ZupT
MSTHAFHQSIQLDDWSYASTLSDAGLILGISLFHFFPESVELSENIILFIVIGFLFFYLLENGIILDVESEIHFTSKSNPHHKKGMAMFWGLFFRSFLAGSIIGVGFEFDPKVGLVISLGVIFHKRPEDTATFTLLINWIKRKATLKLSIAAALGISFGALISLSFFGGLSESMVGLLLAMAGGSFLYIGASDLTPEPHK